MTATHSIRLAILLFAAVHIGVDDVRGQESPLFETRAVWFATVLKDGGWPASASDSPARMEADLRSRIREMHNLGLNTVVYQVIARGDAQYPTGRLPWSGRLKAAGTDPGFDPLGVAIDEAHLLGMELHAWVNVLRVGDPTTVSEFQNVTNPGHVFYENPDWVVSLSGQLWLDPSYPEALQWMSDNVMEVVLNYDVDGIHFDFLRYGASGYPDDLDRFSDDPSAPADINDWRRENVTDFVQLVYPQIMSTKPWVKVGAAPLGNYTPFPGAWPALWAFDDVYQPSRDWLSLGIHDYLAPQLYFDIGREPEPGNTFDSPDFDYLVDDWVTNASGLPIFAGIGPYKSVVSEEIDEQVSLSRTRQARGQFFFRFDHIRSTDFSSVYPNPALPFPLNNRFLPGEPTTPSNLTLAVDSFLDAVQLEWGESAGSDTNPLRGYAVYRAQGRDPDTSSPSDLLTYRPAGSAFFHDDPGTGSSPDLRYSIVATSRMGTLSSPSNIVTNVAVSVASNETPEYPTIDALFPDPAGDQVTVEYSLPSHTNMQIFLYDMVGRQVMSTSPSTRFPGKHSSTLNIFSLGSGSYFLRLATDEWTLTRQFRVVR